MTYVIGTAGHVDHGKSTLVEAMTGIDPDRLAEEKEREMTIDLGFAWLNLPGGTQVGIVDVPGHRDFIENMLAGVGGIDLALFVVAADEGIMPQSREHLAILDLLAVESAIVALTKTDMVDDPEWLELVTLDIDELLSNTALADAPIVPVSARRGDGIADLLAVIEAALAGRPPRPDRGQPRLPVDRVFTIDGFGTVVTGTLVDGSLHVGDEIEFVPDGQQARIRGLQSYKQKLESVAPGSRVAVNLTGVAKDEIIRGQILTLPDLLSGTTLIDVQFRHLADLDRPLEHNAEVKFFSGAAESIAHVRLVGDQHLVPGHTGWLQLRLEEPLALAKGDRYIIRYPSPPRTIGGGIVLDPHPAHRWRRFKADVIERFETLAAGSPQELLLHELENKIAIQRDQVGVAGGLTSQETEVALSELESNSSVFELPENWIMARAAWERTVSELHRELMAYHTAHPLRQGMPREALRSKLKVDTRLFNILISLAADNDLLMESSAVVWHSDHEVQFNPAQQQSIDQLWRMIEAAPVNPPSIKDSIAVVGEHVLHALIERGDLIQVSGEIYFDADTYARLVDSVRGYIQENGSITVAQGRDLLNTSRKYILPLLEYLDSAGITRRSGDERVLR